MELGRLLLGFPMLYFTGMTIMMFQLSGFLTMGCFRDSCFSSAIPENIDEPKRYE